MRGGRGYTYIAAPVHHERREMGRETDELVRIRRLVDAAENIATELERLRLLKEFELGVRVEYSEGDPYVKVDEE